MLRVPHGLARTKPLPQLVMGCDGFLDFCSSMPCPEDMLTEEYAYSVMRVAHEYGIRAFDFSMRQHVVRALGRLRADDPDITCFANVNWRCGVVLDGDDLIDMRERIMRTIVATCLSSSEKAQVDGLSPCVRERWFRDCESFLPLSKTEIGRIELDLGRYRSLLKSARELALYCLVGTDIGDWLALMGRVDIVATMCDEVRDHGMLPIGLTHWPSLTLPRLSELPFDGFWCMLNPDAYLLSRPAVMACLAEVKRPIYAFSILRAHTRSNAAIRDAIRQTYELPGIEGIVVGLKSINEVHQTVAIAFDVVSRLRKHGKHESF